MQELLLTFIHSPHYFLRSFSWIPLSSPTEAIPTLLSICLQIFFVQYFNIFWNRRIDWKLKHRVHMNPSSLAASQLFVIFVRKMKPILHILYNENGLSFMYLTYDLWLLMTGSFSFLLSYCSKCYLWVNAMRCNLRHFLKKQNHLTVTYTLHVVL